ncbi:MAG: FAD-dependent oxidoreductase, partial [Acidobacteriota bacterium]
PGLLTRPVVETWAGVRPGSPDGRPLVGPVDDGVWVASGHYRNGVLLTPWTAETVARWLVGGHSPDDATVRLLAPGRRKFTACASKRLPATIAGYGDN